MIMVLVLHINTCTYIGPDWFLPGPFDQCNCQGLHQPYKGWSRIQFRYKTFFYPLFSNCQVILTAGLTEKRKGMKSRID